MTHRSLKMDYELLWPLNCLFVQVNTFLICEKKLQLRSKDLETLLLTPLQVFNPLGGRGRARQSVCFM